MEGTAIPKVTIGMPVYNGEAYLERSIHSILDQTFTDFELVIADDASRDGTEAICRGFAAADPRVRYNRNAKNLGGSGNYNYVFSLGRGRYFKWSAQDDLIMPTFLEQCVEVLDARPEVVLCQARTKIVDDRMRTLACEDPARLGTDHPKPARRFGGRVRASRCVELYGLMRRDALVGTPLLGPFIGADRALLAELALRGRFAVVPEYLFLNGHHPGRGTRPNVRPSERLAWYKPSGRSRWVLPTWTLYRHYLGAIHRNDPSLGQRLLCYGYLGLALRARWNFARLMVEPLIAVQPGLYDLLSAVRRKTGLAMPPIARAVSRSEASRGARAGGRENMGRRS